MISPTLTIILLAVLFIAMTYDIFFQKIPNILTYPTMGLAVVYYTVFQGFNGCLFSLQGLGVGIGIFILPYVLGGMGAGDVKLMGSVGSVLGPKGVFVAFLITAVIGGIYAVALLVYHAVISRTDKETGATLATIQLQKNTGKPGLCYGVAISLGTLATVFFWNLYK